MRTLIQQFPEQLQHAKSICETTELTPNSKTFRNVLITGMGGSGIGGTVISELATQCRIPILINKSYQLPSWVDAHTLVIGSTYSGNTEETITVVEKAIAQKAELAFVTSGGKALALANEFGLNHIVVPGGNPPRSMMGYSLVGLMHLLNHYGITTFDVSQDLPASISLLKEEQGHMDVAALDIAKSLANHTPIIYAAEGFDGVATRLRQQINENSKMLCWHHIIPEMNHNELVGWAGGNAELAVVILRNESDNEKNQKRIRINKEIFAKHTTNIHEIWSKGNSLLQRMMYLIHFGDWISLHLGELNGVDIVEVNVIDYLKSELAK